MLGNQHEIDALSPFAATFVRRLTWQNLLGIPNWESSTGMASFQEIILPPP